tara:strand:+ start:174 stop:392 length:219 start_codon:yes stop_codon:yes gene_type:complete
MQIIKEVTHPIKTAQDFKLWREFDMELTQTECASKLGYKSRHSIAKIESGHQKITTRIAQSCELLSLRKQNQ